jgi:uncharacterized membrane protein
MRLDYEACLAYLLLPPAGGVFLLVVERKSDYVRYDIPGSLSFLVDPASRSWILFSALANARFRFHAWQSSLLFSAMFILHLLFMRWTFFSWIIFLADIGLMGYLTYRAYIDGMFPTFSRSMLNPDTIEPIPWIDLKFRSLGHWLVAFWMTSKRMLVVLFRYPFLRHGSNVVGILLVHKYWLNSIISHLYGFSSHNRMLARTFISTGLSNLALILNFISS